MSDNRGEDNAAAQERRARAADPLTVTDGTEALALDCIRDAFWDDPLVSWFTRDDAKKADAMAALIGINLARSMKKGCTFVASDGSAAAIWQAPAPPAPVPSLVDQIKRVPFMWRIAGPARLNRFYRLMSVLGPEHPKEPPHYYLHFLGVRPAFQGQGLGSSMLEATLKRVDAERMPAYLESTNIKNVPLYERYGFRIRKEVELAPGGPKAWTMWREARD